MARDESHREDLMAEATALVPRAEFCSPAGTPRLVAGFKLIAEEGGSRFQSDQCESSCLQGSLK